MAELDGFLRRALRRPFAWGRSDCLLLPADWTLAFTGRDPAEAWRGTYDTENGALTLVHFAGGIERLAGAAMASIGARPTDRPARGDVGLVRTACAGFVLAGGICLGGGRWAGQVARGLHVAPAVATLAWRLT